MRLRGSLFLTVLALVFPAIADDHHRDRLQVVEATIADIQQQFRSGDLTPEDLVKMYWRGSRPTISQVHRRRSPRR